MDVDIHSQFHSGTLSAHPPPVTTFSNPHNALPVLFTVTKYSSLIRVNGKSDMNLGTIENYFHTIAKNLSTWHLKDYSRCLPLSPAMP